MTLVRHFCLRQPLTCLVLLILVSALFVENCLATEKTILLAPLPMENRETLVKQYRPLTIFLSNKLGTTVNLDFSDNYAAIIDKFIDGQIDLAYLGPLPYVELKAKYDKAEPLVHFNELSGNPRYTCAIISLADSSIPLQGVQNKRVALTQPLSTCGYLSVNGLLKENGSLLEDNRYTYLGKHDAVALAVVRGEYDIGGIKTAIANKYIHLGLAILAETTPMPSFSLVANSATLSQETMQTLREELTQLDPQGKDKVMLETWGENIRHGAVIASDQDYEVVRRFKGDLEIPTQNKE